MSSIDSATLALVSKRAVHQAGCPYWLRDEALGEAAASLVESERVWDRLHEGPVAEGWLVNTAKWRVVDFVRQWTKWDRRKGAPKASVQSFDPSWKNRIGSPLGSAEDANEMQYADSHATEAFDKAEDRILAFEVLAEAAPMCNQQQLDVIQLYLLDGHTMKEAGEILGVHEARVSQVMLKVREHLQCAARRLGETV